MPCTKRCSPTRLPARIKGDLLHDSAETLAATWTSRTAIPACRPRPCIRRENGPDAAQLLLSPVLRFVKFYVLRLGFLDGVPGLVHILIGCCNSFHKYAKLMALRRGS